MATDVQVASDARAQGVQAIAAVFEASKPYWDPKKKQYFPPWSKLQPAKNMFLQALDALIAAKKDPAVDTATVAAVEGWLLLWVAVLDETVGEARDDAGSARDAFDNVTSRGAKLDATEQSWRALADKIAKTPGKDGAPHPWKPTDIAPITADQNVASSTAGGGSGFLWLAAGLLAAVAFMRKR